MIHFRKIICITAALCLLFGSALAEVSLFCVNVGKGDAIIIQADGYSCLIDTGKKSAEDSIRNAMDLLGVDGFDALFITHTDNDHIGGLKWLRKEKIGALYASAYTAASERKKDPVEKAAKKMNLEVQRLRIGDVVPLGSSGAVFRVLAPIEEYEFNEDDNSLVMMLESPDGSVLLTGDMELDETNDLLDSGADLKCDVLKVPNHGDSDACPFELICACSPKWAVISTDSDEKPGTPASRILKDINNAGVSYAVTQDTQSGIMITLDGGEVTVNAEM